MLRAIKISVAASVTTALVATAQGAAGTPARYAFSFAVAEKPDYAKGVPTMRVTGSGSGSFSIAHRQVDRDGTVFWDLTDARGTLSLVQGGRVLIRADVVGGEF